VETLPKRTRDDASAKRQRRPASEQILRIGGIRLHVRESGEGRPLLLVNGIGAHVGMWRPLELALDGVHLIEFDAPGTGRSQMSSLPLSLDALARLAERVIDELGHEQVDVLGYSFGGIVAQHLAHRSPRRVRRLVLAATTPGWGGVSGSLRTMARMSTPLRYYSRTYYEHTIGDIAGGRARSDPEWLKRHGDERQEHPPHPLGYMWQLAALTVPPGTLPWLHTLPQPTLVLGGDDDPILPFVNSLLLAQRIPGARLLRAHGEGHLLLLDPDSVAHAVIRDFVRCDDLPSSEAFGRTIVVDEATVRAALGEDGMRMPHPVRVLNSLTRAVYGPVTRLRPAAAAPTPGWGRGR
jgi:pimeloyl-ACP methyl ester carboxylesterase